MLAIITYSLPEPNCRFTSTGGVLSDGLSTVTVVLLDMTCPKGLPAVPGRRLRPRLALSYPWFLSGKPNGYNKEWTINVKCYIGNQIPKLMATRSNGECKVVYW